MIFAVPLEKICLLMRTAITVFREEVAKAARAFAVTYHTVREIDARTMEILLALIGRTK